MTNPIIRIHNTETNEVLDREMTNNEFAQYNAKQEAFVIEKAEKEFNATAKAALLNRLGITENEAQLLLS